jgi:hypothetical protein
VRRGDVGEVGEDKGRQAEGLKFSNAGDDLLVKRKFQSPLNATPACNAATEIVTGQAFPPR